MGITRVQRPAPYSMQAEEWRTIIHDAGEEDSQIIRVHDTRFKVNRHLLQAGSTVFKSILDGRGRIPIELSGHTVAQFRAFLWAVHAQPLPSVKSVDIARLCSIAEVAFKYDYTVLKTWSMDGIRALVESTDSILRTAQSDTFIRLIRLALLYRSPDLSRAVQSRWLTRMHWHELPSAPALVIADAYDLRHLLCHAYYVHLVNVAPLIARAQPIDMYLSLSASQNLHVLCGYHSLRAVWRHLQADPLAFGRADGCSSQVHKRCLVAWAARWAFEMGRPCALPSVDVLRRLLLMEQHLEADMVLRECMHVGCWRAALEAIARKRAEISDNLHHHFDL